MRKKARRLQKGQVQPYVHARTGFLSPTHQNNLMISRFLRPAMPRASHVVAVIGGIEGPGGNGADFTRASSLRCFEAARQHEILAEFLLLEPNSGLARALRVFEAYHSHGERGFQRP